MNISGKPKSNVDVAFPGALRAGKGKCPQGRPQSLERAPGIILGRVDRHRKLRSPKAPKPGRLIVARGRAEAAVIA